MRGTAGYSLLEMLVVLAIMALIVAVAAPAVGASVERMTLRSDARAAAQGLRVLRERALDQQADIALTVSADAPNTLRASDGGAIVLASGTKAELASGRLLISWDGRIAGALRLSRGGATAQIVGDRLTGRLRAEVTP